MHGFVLVIVLPDKLALPEYPIQNYLGNPNYPGNMKKPFSKKYKKVNVLPCWSDFTMYSSFSAIFNDFLDS